MVRLNKLAPLFFIFFSLSNVSHAAFETQLTATQLQSVLQVYFPLQEYTAIARVALQEPKVSLRKGTKSIVLVIPVDVNITDSGIHHGRVWVELGLSYKPSSGSLYLSKPRVQKLEMPTVAKAMRAKLQAIIETVGENAFPVVRIYKVKEEYLNHSLAKSVLKNASIGDGRLDLEFGFD